MNQALYAHMNNKRKKKKKKESHSSGMDFLMLEPGLGSMYFSFVRLHLQRAVQ
jgi:hypothetical protein